MAARVLDARLKAADVATQADRRRWRNAVEAALNERDAGAGYQARQREMRGSSDATAARLGSRQFDESGFPVPQPIPGFVQRVRRLIYGG